jgi:hypothetical protein
MPIFGYQIEDYTKTVEDDIVHLYLRGFLFSLLFDYQGIKEGWHILFLRRFPVRTE